MRGYRNLYPNLRRPLHWLFPHVAALTNTAISKPESIVWLLRDDFTTAASAPLPSTRNCEPGPGQFDVRDDNSVFSIASGKLTQTGVGSSPSDPSVRSIGTFARVAGRTLFFQNNGNGRPYSAWADASYTATHGIYEHNRGYAIDKNPSNVETPDTPGNTDHIWAFVLRDTGCIYLAKGGIYSDWTCIWVDDIRTDTPLTAYLANRDTTAETRQFIRVTDLPTPFSTDTGFATSYVASPGVGETTTMEANAHVKFNWTAATGETLDLMFRRIDDNNTLICRCDQAGSTIKLIEVESGVENEVASAAATWTDSVEYEVHVRAAGAGIYLYQDGGFAHIKSGSSVNLTEAGVKTSHAGTNLSTWPYTPSTPTKNMLNKRVA